jgi:hypothetical protein
MGVSAEKVFLTTFLKQKHSVRGLNRVGLKKGGGQKTVKIRLCEEKVKLPGRNIING